MATLPAPHTWTAGDDATSTNLQTLTDALAFLIAPPRCHAYRSAAVQTLTTGTLTAIGLDAEDTDTDSMHSNVTNNSRITIVTSGRYRIFAQATFATSATGYRTVGVYKNGSANLLFATRYQAGPTVTHIQQASDEALLTAGDYIEMHCVQASGGNLDVQTGSNATFLHAVWVSTT